MTTQNVPAHIVAADPEGTKTILVGLPYDTALEMSLDERRQALTDHVENEAGGPVDVVQRQFHSYTRNDGYIYRLWYRKQE